MTQMDTDTSPNQIKVVIRWLATVLAIMLLGPSACAGQSPTTVTPLLAEAEEVNLAPDHWGEGVLELYAELGRFQPPSSYLATGREEMVAGTIAAPAIRAGLEALRQGGSAADAAMVTALAQVALTPGNFITYAGLMTMTYYDAGTGQVHSMNAAYDIPREETDPLSIPIAGSGIPSGRATLVSGFMAGVEAAHQRFGRLPFVTLFEPAIAFAEAGFVLDPFHAGLIENHRAVLSRLPETKQVFTKEDGSFYTAGDLFRQPALAGTLRAVTEQGADYMYTGPWAEKFVAAVRAEGGKISLEDMAAYEVIWSDPTHTTYGDYDVYGPGLPNIGGLDAIEAFNLLEAAGLNRASPYTESPETLFWLMQILRVENLSLLPADDIASITPGKDLSPEARMSKETAGWLWEQMQAGQFPLTTAPLSGGGDHSAAVVAVDRWGNMAAVTHSINALWWGETGIFVDGVSIPDSAAHQQPRIAQARPGNRLPDPTNPLIILKNGRPVVASACIGHIHRESVQRLINILDYGLDPKSALDAPILYSPFMGSTGIIERVPVGAFAPPLLEGVRAMGQEVEERQLSIEELVVSRGWWVGIVVDPATGTIQGGAPRDFGGYAVGY